MLSVSWVSYNKIFNFSLLSHKTSILSKKIFIHFFLHISFLIHEGLYHIPFVEFCSLHVSWGSAQVQTTSEGYEGYWMVLFSGRVSRKKSFCSLVCPLEISNQSLSVPEVMSLPVYPFWKRGCTVQFITGDILSGSSSGDKPGIQRVLHTLTYARIASRSVKVTQNLEILEGYLRYIFLKSLRYPILYKVLLHVFQSQYLSLS